MASRVLVSDTLSEAGLANVLLTPHEAGGSQETVPRMIALALANIRLHLAGEPLSAEIPEFAARA